MSETLSAIATPQHLNIASRESRLALWQAEHVRALLGTLYPACKVEIVGMTTRGDQILDRALSKIGGKGLFVKELELALLDGRCDFAVHSLKDVPMALPPEFTLAAILEREDARDALVSNLYSSLEDLPDGAVVGTSSLRRQAQLHARFPHLRVEPLRGNLDTRLGKLDRGDFAAIILAAAGLKRLGLAQRIRTELDPAGSLPAAGQGALAIEIRADRSDLMQVLAPLHHPGTAACVTAERAVSRALGGSCEVPLAAHATLDGTTLRLDALVAREDGSAIVRASSRGLMQDADAIGTALGQKLIAQGALDLLTAH